MREDRTMRVLAVLGSVVFFFAAPGTVGALVPWWMSRWRIQATFPGSSVFRLVGAILVIAGILVLTDSFARFALQGLGTPAPVSPPRRLVATGLYRYVRNPMYLAVVSAIVEQALFFGSLGLLAYVATRNQNCERPLRTSTRPSAPTYLDGVLAYARGPGKRRVGRYCGLFFSIFWGPVGGCSLQCKGSLAESCRRPGASACRFIRAIARRGICHQGVEEASGHHRYLLDGAVERCFVSFRGLVESR